MTCLPKHLIFLSFSTGVSICWLSCDAQKGSPAFILTWQPEALSCGTASDSCRHYPWCLSLKCEKLKWIPSTDNEFSVYFYVLKIFKKNYFFYFFCFKLIFFLFFLNYFNTLVSKIIFKK